MGEKWEQKKGVTKHTDISLHVAGHVYQPFTLQYEMYFIRQKTLEWFIDYSNVTSSAAAIQSFNEKKEMCSYDVCKKDDIESVRAGRWTGINKAFLS